MTENEIATKALDVCFSIHKQYGPGLFESVYEEIFCYEWQKSGVPILRQHPIPLIHETVKLEAGFRADAILDNKVIIELKSIETLADIHFEQVLTYLKIDKFEVRIIDQF